MAHYKWNHDKNERLKTDEEGKFLKTIIPSRKATRDYLRG
jgi:hypothetical protein